MKVLLRHAFFLTLALALSWWLFLYGPAPDVVPRAPLKRALPMMVTPQLDVPGKEAALEQVASAPERGEIRQAAIDEVASQPQEEERPEDTAPPPPELGSPDADEDEAPAPSKRGEEPEQKVAGAEEDEANDSPSPAAEEASVPENPEGVGESGEADPAEEAGGEPAEEQAATSPPRAEDLMRDAALLDAAHLEFSDEGRKGFSTVLLASPEEQLSIARFFGEELVLIPRRTLDPEGRNPRYFRLTRGDEPAVETVHGSPPLDGYRQYRDLFDYEYARLPAPLRALRRSVLSRSEIYLFAALIPPQEWAVVIGRRREALAQAGRSLSEVERFTLRYECRTDGGTDVSVEEIAFADGSRFRPSPKEAHSP